jgi:hypothetical protein
MTNAEIEHTAPAATAKFRQWAQDTNADIGHWAQRWNESLYLQNFSMITIPHKVRPIVLSKTCNNALRNVTVSNKLTGLRRQSTR